jgi:hypothetical protein
MYQHSKRWTHYLGSGGEWRKLETALGTVAKRPRRFSIEPYRDESVMNFREFLPLGASIHREFIAP